MRIRNKLLVAMTVPVGLLVVQIVSVNYFVRELQSAVTFIAAAHSAIEADFSASGLVAELRREVKQLPSLYVAEPGADDARRLGALWEKLAANLEAMRGSPAIGAADAAARMTLDAASATVRQERRQIEAMLGAGRPDLDVLIERAIFADRALARLDAALGAMTIELRKQLDAAVVRERLIHDRPVIAGLAIGGLAVVLMLLFAWLYVDRRLVTRVVGLSGSMRDIAGGNLAAALPARGSADEIGEMVDALTVFRATAQEVEEQRLRERQVVLDTIDYGVLILDRELRVRMHNRAFCDLWRLPDRSVREGLAFAELLASFRDRGLHEVAEASWEAYVAGRLAELRGGATAAHEWHRPDGRTLQHEVVPLPDGGRLLTYFDLTELKRVEAELRVAKEQAELASRAKSDFLASMSHELRTPLNAIIGITEMLKEDAEDDGDERLEEPLGRVLRAGRLLLQLINEVLDLAKIEAGKLELLPEAVELRELLEDMAATARPLAEKHANRLVLRLAPDLGRVWADPMRIRQIVLNLLSNACKFTKNGTVTLEASQHEGQVVIAVRDTGIGIEPEQLPRLFQEFHQAGVAKHRSYGGTGLGLAISRRLVSLMEGEIEVESEFGRGSVFKVTLPLRAPAESEAA